MQGTSPSAALFILQGACKLAKGDAREKALYGSNIQKRHMTHVLCKSFESEYRLKCGNWCFDDYPCIFLR